jgi:23S rRNA pseudouridine1911/1915/1917 synthase
MVEPILCGPEANGIRLDAFLSQQFPDQSRTSLQAWISAGGCQINGKPAKKNALLREGDRIDGDANALPQREIRLIPQNIPLAIHFEDERLLLVEKPKGMVTHPGNGVPDGTLANALAYHFKDLSDVNGPLRPGILHRLDRDTSGLLVIAKDNSSHKILAEQLMDRSLTRIYSALVWGEPEKQFICDAPLDRDPRQPWKRAVRPHGKVAETHAEVLEYFQFASHLELQLKTGRTHQIRVHLRHKGFPVVGDALYGGDKEAMFRVEPLYKGPAAALLRICDSQALHAKTIRFLHPSNGQEMQFNSPLPEPFLQALTMLQSYRRIDTPDTEPL